MVLAEEEHEIAFAYETGTATDGNRKVHPKGWSHYIANFEAVMCTEKTCTCVNADFAGEEVPFWAMEGFFEFVEASPVLKGFQHGVFKRIKTNDKNEAIFE